MLLEHVFACLICKLVSKQLERRKENMNDEDSKDEQVSYHPLESRTRRNTAVRTSANRDPVVTFLRDKQIAVKPKVTLNDVSLDLKGIQTLAENDCWKEVLKLCERCLQLGFAPHELLQYRLSQIISLLRLHLNQFAQQNIDSLGDLNNSNVYFYEYYGTMYKQQKGNMVPFSLLLLKAIIPHFCNMDLDEPQTSENNDPMHGKMSSATGSSVTLDRLYKLLHLCGSYLPDGGILLPKKSQQLQEEKKEDSSIWYLREKRVLFFIINVHIACKQNSLAIELLEKTVAYFDESHYQRGFDPDHFATLLSLLGCLYLQSGILSAAEQVFARVETMSKTHNSQVINIRVRMNRGYLRFVQGKYSDAIKEFDFVLLELDPLNILAANNRAVCYLYSRNLGQAIASIEEFLRKDPLKTLDETLIYNLTTMYDLESENSGNKKKVIMMMINRFAGDDFPTSALKLI
jgi:tetratricopeptide (TPR) repeat protein